MPHVDGRLLPGRLCLPGRQGGAGGVGFLEGAATRTDLRLRLPLVGSVTVADRRGRVAVAVRGALTLLAGFLVLGPVL